MGKVLTAAVASPKTTSAAALAVLALIAVLAESGQKWISGEPIDWNVVATAILAAATSFGLFVSRDADKSSQDSKIRG